MTFKGMTGTPVAAFAALVLTSASLPAADEAPGRYTMSPAEGGVVRLDRDMGAMSFCTGKDGSWSCTPMADTQDQLKSEIDRLEAENSTLKAENKRLAERAGPPVSGEPDTTVPAEPPGGKVEIPTEKDVDKLFDYVEGMVKKFRERIERLEKETEPGTPL